MTTVAVLDDYQGLAHRWADWDSLADEVEVTFFSEPIAADRLVSVLSGFEVLVLMRERTRMDRAVLEALVDLRLVITTGMRNASLDVDCLTERGVTVCGTGMETPAVGVPTTVEVAWALILAITKRVTLEDQALRRGHWQTGLSTALAGRTLGLAGLGRLGGAMVGPARAFGMEVIAWSAHLTADRARQAGAELVSRAELLARSDVLSIHLVLSDRTRGLIGAAELAAMKDTAVIINTSRGPIIDQDALVAALRAQTIAGAGLDVFDTEPLPADHPLTTLGNAVLLPHLGYVTESGMREMYEQVVQDIAAWRAGSPVRVIG